MAMSPNPMRPATTVLVNLFAAVAHTTVYRTISVSGRTGGSIVDLVQMKTVRLPVPIYRKPY